MNEGRFGDAALEFSASVRLDPSRPATFHRLGEAYLGVRRLNDAESAFRRALDLEPDKYLSYMGLGHALRLQARHSEAIEAYRRAAQLESKEPDPYSFIGEVLESTGDDQAAAEAFSEAARLTPPEEASRALLQWARTLMAISDYKKAEEVFQRMIIVMPDSVDAWLGIAEARVRLGSLESAAKAYQKASELDPLDTITMYLLAVVHKALGDNEQALSTLKGALEVRPECPRLWTGVASVHVKAQRRHDAKVAAERALEHLGGDSIELIRDVAALLSNLGDARRSAELYRLLLLESEMDLSLWISLARELESLGEHEEVRMICKRVIEVSKPEDSGDSFKSWCQNFL